MSQAEIYEVLKQYKGQKLTAEQIAQLVYKNNAIHKTQLVYRRLAKMLKYYREIHREARTGKPNVFYYEEVNKNIYI